MLKFSFSYILRLKWRPDYSAIRFAFYTPEEECLIRKWGSLNVQLKCLSCKLYFRWARERTAFLTHFIHTLLLNTSCILLMRIRTISFLSKQWTFQNFISALVLFTYVLHNNNNFDLAKIMLLINLLLELYVAVRCDFLHLMKNQL